MKLKGDICSYIKCTCCNSNIESNVFFDEAITSEYASLTSLSALQYKDLTCSCRQVRRKNNVQSRLLN